MTTKANTTPESTTYKKEMRLIVISTILFCLIGVIVHQVQSHEGHSHSHEHDHDDYDEDDDIDLSYVTCGSVIKLRHAATGYRMHSHQVTYGSGSGQQSVTGYAGIEDPNSLWIVAGIHDKHCPTGTPLKNNDAIRLQHLQTGKNLHSHLHKSPLTNQQEVSCFGDSESGDTGDHWKVLVKSGEPHWKRDSVILFQHVDTGKYLSSNKNKFNHPIPGQQEICAIGQANKDTEWTAEEGFYFPSKVVDE